jgi:hypothetical protein
LGAYSNHIAAVPLQEKRFKTIGIIRGDELRDKIATNPTLICPRLNSNLSQEKNTD